MDTLTVSNIQTRNDENLIGNVRSIRICHFFTPSSFYVQLTDEDEKYEVLNRDLADYYSISSLYFYCKGTTTVDIDDPYRRLKISELQPKMNVAVKVNDKWERCIMDEHNLGCILMDCGCFINLNSIHEESGIFELEHRFLTLPPRAMLCGLGKIIPISPTLGYRWTLQACKQFERVTKDRDLRALFLERGVLDNAYYIFLTSVSKENVKIHVNILLCAFDTAVGDVGNLHHPIWPTDIPV